MEQKNMIKNASDFATILYGKHFASGLAEYSDKEGKPYRIFLNEETVREMGATFPGKPIYVQHVDSIDLANIQEEADGWVTESFFNASDSAHWCKMVIISDRAKEAIKKGWKLSNAYVPESFGPAGVFHGVDYVKEITKATYEHLAIVERPRYAESIILTPEEFKAYNAEKNIELSKVLNSKGESDMGILSALGLAKEEEKVVVNAEPEKKEEVKEVEEKKEDAIEPKVEAPTEEKKEKEMAQGHHLVNVGDEVMTVDNMLKLHGCMKQELADLKKPKEEVEAKKEDGEDPKEHEAAKEKLVELEKHEEESIKEAKKNNFETLKNAEKLCINKIETIELSTDQVARGKQLFGSNK